MPLDSTMQCLCCDKLILVDIGTWNSMEMPIALCFRCRGTVPQALVKVLFIVRSQISSLHNEVILMKKDIKKLYVAQQELEQTSGA